jgi:hypothetical protein
MNPDVWPQSQVIAVSNVELGLRGPPQVLPSLYPGPAGRGGSDLVLARLAPHSVQQVRGKQRPRPDEAHVRRRTSQSWGGVIEARCDQSNREEDLLAIVAQELACATRQGGQSAEPEKRGVPSIANLQCASRAVTGKNTGRSTMSGLSGPIAARSPSPELLGVDDCEGQGTMRRRGGSPIILT